MCIFLILVFPNELAACKAREIARPLHTRLDHVANEYLQKQLAAGEWPVYANRERCDCGTPLGRLNPPDADPEDELFDPDQWFDEQTAKQRDRHAKAGWSTTKIERWEAQRERVKSLESRLRAHREAMGLETMSLNEWKSFLHDLLQQQDIRRVGVLIHMFSGDRKTERIQVKHRMNHRLSSLNDDPLLNLEWDVLHEFENR